MCDKAAVIGAGIRDTVCMNQINHVVRRFEYVEKLYVTVLWNQQVQSDRAIPNNKPDIVIHVNEKGTCMLIDVAVSGDMNMIKKEREKTLKDKDTTLEIWRVWIVKTKVIPIITGAT